MKTINDFFTSISKTIRKAPHKNEWTATIVSEGSKPWRTIIRFDNGQEMEVYNNRMATIPNLKVIVGTDPTMPGELHVLRPNDAERSWNYWVVNHHKSHEYPNHDTVWTFGGQIMPFNVLPAGAFTVTVYCDDALRGDGEWVKGTTATIDLAASVPTVGARFVLIEIDETGAIVTTDGDVVDDRYLLTFADIPEPTTGRFSTFAVMLYDGQDELRRDTRYGKRNDFVDLRWGNWNRAGGGTGTFDLAAEIHAADASALSDADEFGFWENAANALRKITWANIIAALDALYATVSHSHAHNDTTSKQGGTTGEYYHLSLNEHDELTQGGLTSLHIHDASELIGGDMLEVFHAVPLNVLDGNTFALAYDEANNSIYVGGDFTGLKNVIGTKRGILRYNLTTSEWETLGSGSNLPSGTKVYALLIDGDDVYIGGDFVNADGLSTADYIVKYSIAGDSFASIGGSLNGAVQAIVKYGSDIIVGGYFSNAAGISSADMIAKYTPGTATWSSIGGSLNGDVTAMVVDGTDLYIGGLFTNAGGISTADYIAKWNGLAWSSIGGTLNNSVYALCIADGILYVGGGFTDANGIAQADRIAKYTIAGGTWAAVPNSTFDGTVAAIANHDGYIFVGGYASNKFSMFSTISEAWNNDIADCDASVRAILVIPERVMVGGDFGTVNGESSESVFWLFITFRDALAYFDNMKADTADFEQLVADFEAHVANVSNPHSVTAAQAAAIPENGWVERSETWSRTGNHTFTVSGDQTLIFRKGTKVRYKDSGSGSNYEYGVVISSSYSASNTTVTLATNDDYAIASGSITSPAISHVENPEGFPHWFNYASTITFSASGSMTYTSVSVTAAKFRVIGNTVHVIVNANGTTGGTASNQLRSSAPITPDSIAHPLIAAARDATTGGAAVGTGAVVTPNIVVYKPDLSNYGLGTGRIMFAEGFFTY